MTRKNPTFDTNLTQKHRQELFEESQKLVRRIQRRKSMKRPEK